MTRRERAVRREHPHRSLYDLFGHVVPDWYGDALCAQVDPGIFFPDKPGPVARARATCNTCPVQETCLDYAVENRIDGGVWGGVPERERRKLWKPKEEAS